MISISSTCVRPMSGCIICMFITCNALLLQISLRFWCLATARTQTGKCKPSTSMLTLHDHASLQPHLIYSLYIRKALGGRGADAAQLAAWRVAVEHEFNHIYVWFPSLKNKKKNKLFGRSALVQTYTCAALLVNMRCCLRDNQIANYYGVLAPTLHDFMSFEPAL
jgi:hypothetical protein